MKKLVVLGMGLCVALAFSSCKSSESAYKKAYEKAKQERNEMINDYNQNYSKLNRNDKCSCGSNKKFKVCCLPKFKEKGIAN